MNTIPSKKLIIINILDILNRYTDEEHTLSQTQIQKILKNEYSMPVGRRAVKDNLMNLCDIGYPIDYEIKPRTKLNKETGEYEDNSMLTGFYIAHDFEEYEVKLLMDSLLFSKHIPKKFRNDLIKKLEKLTTVHFRNSTKNIEVPNSVTTQNKEWFINIDSINQAINQNNKINFTYNDYGTDKKLHPIGKHTVNPYKIAVANDHYYLICNEEPFDNYNHYRIDRITKLEVLNEEHFAPLKTLNTKQYLATHLYMLPGEAQHVKMIVDKTIIGDVIDYFGDEFRIIKTENDKLEIWIQSNADDIYYWALQYGNHVEIIEPQELRDRIRVTVETMAKTYLSSDDDKYEKAVERARKKHWLLLTHTNVKNKTFEEVPADITGLMLIGNDIDNTEFLNQFTELITIYISDQKVGSFEFLEKQKNLRDLTMGSCGFFDLKYIKNCESLQYLHLLDSEVGSLEVLFELPKLKSLNVTYELAEKIDITSLKKNNPNLKVELNK